MAKLLGEILIERGKLDAANLERALRAQETDKQVRIGAILVRAGMTAERDVVDALSAQLELPVVDVKDYPELPVLEERVAVRFIKEAEAYKIAAINKAGGDAGRFEQMLTEYEMDRQKETPDVTATRLYLESMEKVLAKVKKYIVDPKKGGTLNLRLLQKE